MRCTLKIEIWLKIKIEIWLKIKIEIWLKIRIEIKVGRVRRLRLERRVRHGRLGIQGEKDEEEPTDLCLVKCHALLDISIPRGGTSRPKPLAWQKKMSAGRGRVEVLSKKVTPEDAAAGSVAKGSYGDVIKFGDFEMTQTGLVFGERERTTEDGITMSDNEHGTHKKCKIAHPWVLRGGASGHFVLAQGLHGGHSHEERKETVAVHPKNLITNTIMGEPMPTPVTLKGQN